MPLVYERISELFHFEILVACDDASTSPSDVVGQPAQLTFNAEDGDLRFVHGIVARFAFGDAGKKLAVYRVTLVPKVWRLLHRHDCRIFQGQSAPEIIQAVFVAADLTSGDGSRSRPSLAGRRRAA